MLEVKNLVKCYSTKGGVTVKALDDVSVKFPETGMVFLLGRSGSGKSTLLNVSGGLDKPDSGEIVVKGRSSKDFSTSDFDSYRNTYVGFVFQEYNILNEFTVEQNISLALQLQSKPNDKKAVNELLEQVDLKGLGKRKPNTLSGGQKQRVAIARALIKNPEIIMADEPTGALDSNTGRQVLDTLKKLSKTKLVVIVSHDREFAEYYGDRIIELKDGKIISDISKEVSTPKQLNQNVQIISDDTISIKNAEDVTEADVKNILSVLKKNKGEAIITAGKRELPDVKRACKINDNGIKEFFADTKEIEVKEYDGKKTKFIKSKLPASHAFKMGASGLKTKPIRLIFTILLSVVAFVLFGVVSTFALYDPNYSVSEALKEAGYPSVTVSKGYVAKNKQYRIYNSTGEEKLTSENEQTYFTRFGTQELQAKNEISNGAYAGIFNFTKNKFSSGNSVSLAVFDGLTFISPNVDEKVKDYYPVTTIYGFTDCGAEYMQANGFTLIGDYPTNSSEIAVPEYVAKMFAETDGTDITEVIDIIGKKIKFSNCEALSSSGPFTVVGVYNVGEIPSKYDDLKDSDSTQLSQTERSALERSLLDYLNGSFNNVIYVSADFYEAYKNNIPSGDGGIQVSSYYSNGLELSEYEISEDVQEWSGDNLYTEKTVRDYSEYVKLYDLNGNAVNNANFTLLDTQVYVSKSIIDREKKNVLAEYGRQIVDTLSRYDVTAKNTISSGSDFANKISNIYDLEDFSAIEDTINLWYPKLAERQFLYEFYHTELINRGESIPLNVRQAGDRIENLVSNGPYNNATEEDWSVLKEWVAQNTTIGTFTPNFNVSIDKIYYKNYEGRSGELQVAGYLEVDADSYCLYMVSDNFRTTNVKVQDLDDYSWKSIEVTEYVEQKDAKYNYLIRLTDNSLEQISETLSAETGAVVKITNSVYAQLESFIYIIGQMERIFLIVGIVMGVFAALMLLNFISVSISAKRKDIGILRAVGARGVDVFKIFFAEAFIIAIICFAFATVGAYVVCQALNNSLINIVSIKLLDFNIVNVGFVFAVSMGVSLIATFFPVYFASKKSPVESIRAL